MDDRKDALKATPDPFALEMMVEGIAQFAVLVFRLGGEDAKNRGQELLSIKNMNNSILSIQEKEDRLTAIGNHLIALNLPAMRSSAK